MKKIKWNEVLFIFRDGRKGFDEFMHLVHKYTPMVEGKHDDEGFEAEFKLWMGDRTTLTIIIYSFMKQGKFNLYMDVGIHETTIVSVICKIMGIKNVSSFLTMYYSTKNRVDNGFWKNKEIITELGI